VEDILQIIATNARARREELALSQEEVAERSGLHRTYVGGVERGERNISARSLAKLAKGLDCAVRLLVTRP
jgi:transcriptional regulator with XRE-family HTH domain